MIRVLIVDDDKLARKGLIAVIDWKKYDFCVTGDVQNGKKALEFMEKNPVDLVFTDIDMPEMNGLDLMKICKTKFPQTDFVIFSVYEDFSYARQALRLGALDYISKIEFDPEECEKIIEKISAHYKNTKGSEERVPARLEDEESEYGKTLEKDWIKGYWLFDEEEMESLCRRSEQISVRYMERILFQTFHSLNLPADESRIPVFHENEELLSWIRKWWEDLWQRMDGMDDIGICIRAIRYIKEHITEDVRPEEAAENVGMSRSYFCAKFKECTGETFHGCVIRHKMRYAAEQLQEGRSVTEVALELGYENLYYFSKLFIKEYGCQPGAFKSKKMSG